MNKTAIKNFAIWARNKLIADITYKTGLLGISEKEIKSPLPQSTKDVQFFDIGTKEPYSISGIDIKQREKLATAIYNKEQQSDYQTAYKTVIEEVAYTWFNRLIAVRFMEVNDYLPSRIRVLSSESSGKNEPDLVTNPFDTDLNFTPYEKDRIMQLKQDNQLDELFRMLFTKQCNALNAILPNLFEKTSDYTELLLNVAFTDKDGVVYHLVHDIAEDDFNVSKEGQVEIIGWLYQYYNTEPKDETFALLKKNVKITKERIPAATQLFTPDWIVRYMVENSLGRLWLEGHPNDNLKSEWKYYLDEAEQEADVQKQLDVIREEYKTIKPEDIKVIDPCMGSGHIFVYAFDVLMQIYESYGYSQRDAAKSIIENNIYGLDIDNRAYQLAYFAVMMKARQYNRRILNGETNPHVYAIRESNSINRDQLQYFGDGMDEMQRNIAMLQIQGLLDTFIDAKEYGSILNVDGYDWELLHRLVDKLGMTGQLSFDTVGVEDTQDQLRLLVEIGAVMAQKYDVVVTNPPYMGISNGNGKLNEFVKKNYPDSKADLFAVFIEKCGQMIKKYCYQAMITQHSWMFLSRFEKLRAKLQMVDTVNMAHLGARAFEEIGGEVVQTTAFIMRKTYVPGYKGVYVRLVKPTTQQGKENMFLMGESRFAKAQQNFSKIPGMPIAYWVGEKLAKSFDSDKNVESVAQKVTKGIYTGNNDQYLRLWYEVSSIQIENDGWHNYSKGGSFRKWYGNSQHVVQWENDAFELRHFPGSGMGASKYYDNPHIVWSGISTGKPSFRYDPDNVYFDDVSPAVVLCEEKVYLTISQLNSAVSEELLKIIAPTMHFQIGDIKQLPLCEVGNYDEIIENVKQNIEISRTDWDSFEISWDFVRHPFLQRLELRVMSKVDKNSTLNSQTSTLIKTAYENWNNACDERFAQLRANEEELNRIFIDIYGLQDELTPEVDDKDVTIRKADLSRDICSFLSYAVGCMFGRYSLNVEGLLYAGGEYSIESGVMKVKYRDEGGELRVKCSDGTTEHSTLNTKNYFSVDADNIIPITDEEYFEDDIVGLFVAFVKKVYGSETLEENLDFIAKALGNKGNTSREIIRNYFLKDFYKDHCKVYQKRPIYWLFDSGKADGFKAMIYMHRYDENTIGNLRIDYLHKMQRIYEREISRMQETIDNSTNAREVAAAEKRKEKLTKQLKETKDYDEKIAHLALARIAIDLDDGVKVNYEKVQTGTDGKRLEVLAKI
jgi:type II restriction/modification system DNA methylase subunit YeeA